MGEKVATERIEPKTGAPSQAQAEKERREFPRRTFLRAAIILAMVGGARVAAPPVIRALGEALENLASASHEQSKNLIFGEQFWGHKVRVRGGEIEILEKIVGDFNSKFNTQRITIEMVREINKLESDQLEKDQRLIIPVLSLAGPEVKNPRQEVRIFVLGDSNLVIDANEDGVLDDPHFPNYAATVMEEAIPGLEVKTQVLGVPGGDVRDLEKYLWFAEVQQPDIVILQYGNNDIREKELWQGSPTLFERLLEKNVRRLTDRKVVLIGPFCGQKREDKNYDPEQAKETIIPIYKRIADQINQERGEDVVLVVDAYEETENHIIGVRELAQENKDYAHLNLEGQKIVGEISARRMIEAGWISQ